MSSVHKNLADSQLHEPKGVASAASGNVYTADGAGSGTWSDPFSSLNNKNIVVLSTINETDMVNGVGSGAITDTAYISIPIAGKIVGISVTAINDVGTNNSVISVGKISSGNAFGAKTNMTSGGSTSILTLDHTVGTNQTVSAVIDGSNDVLTTDVVCIYSDGGGTANSPCAVSLILDVS